MQFDKTATSTPKTDFCAINKIPKRLEAEIAEISIASDDSIGVSIDSINLNEQSVTENLKQQRSLANDVLERASNITSLPSRYFKPSELSNDNTSFHLKSESTLNETDMLKSQCTSSRSSLGASISHLSNQIKNNNISVDDIFQRFQETMESFNGGEDIEKQLEEDERQFKKDAIPTNEFSISRENSLAFSSIGSYFNAQSDSLRCSLAKSPVKSGQPYPLVDLNNAVEGDSLSISKIGKILSEESSTKIMEMFFSEKGRPSKNSEAPSAIRKSSMSLGKTFTNVHPKSQDNKENINHLNIESTSRSSSSLSNLPDGKLPIESTKIEMVWGCVKPGKSVSQEFILRNRSDNRLKLQMSLSQSSFKILKNRTDLDAVSNLKLVLHAREAKSFTISFSPIKTGPVIDELIFSSLDLEQTKKQSIRLFAYGGHEHIEFEKLAKDSTGKYWLALGKLDCVNRDNQPISQKFLMKNTGTVACFAVIAMSPSQYFAFNKVEIVPDRFIILPGEEKHITVTYIPVHDDYNFILNITKNVLEIGYIVVLTGAEVTRARIKRLCRKAAEQNFEVDQICNNIKYFIKGESSKLSDATYFKESLASMKDICQHLKRHQIILTLEQDLDRTLVQQYPDNTSLFQTITRDMSLALNNTIEGECCKLEPKSIMLTPPVKTEDILIFTSKNSKELQFDVVSKPEGLQFTPKEGLISTDETVLIKVKCLKNEMKNFKVIVFVDNEALEVDVKVVVL